MASAEIAQALANEQWSPRSSASQDATRSHDAGLTKSETGSLSTEQTARIVDYDAILVMATAPTTLDPGMCNLCRQLNPNGFGIPEATQEAVRTMCATAKKKITSIMNMLGHVRAVEMDDLLKRGKLRRLDRSIAPELYDRVMQASLREFQRMHPDKVQQPGWEGSPDHMAHFRSRFGSAVERHTSYTQSIIDGQNNVFVASVGDLPQFRAMMLEGAIQIASAELCEGILAAYSDCGSLDINDKAMHWERFCSLISKVVEEVSK